jgi:2,4-dienoyl-CoA reductase-like NADH-dependent reductase (Old Yellow Enzyme family)
MSDASRSTTQSIHHGCPTGAQHDREVSEVDLLSPLAIRGVTFRNRIAVSPMCQYCAKEGFADDWHLVHLGSRAVGGASLVFVEATAVTRDGRITGGDLGIWDDDHTEPLARIARFVLSQGAIPGIQLAHAGRKASCDVPWNGGARLKTPAEGGWTVVAPSPIPFNDGDPTPVALDQAGIDTILGAFEAAAKRALKAGFRVIEIHAAHGYLLHEFLSPLANQRTDTYGGSFDNRIRLLLQVVDAVRVEWPAHLPIFVRISATDWANGGWNIEESVQLAHLLRNHGVDLIDCSSGGQVPNAQIPVGPGFQVQFAARIRREANIPTAAVGMITDPVQANNIVANGEADLIFLAREMLRDPYFPLHAAAALEESASWPVQYLRAAPHHTPARTPAIRPSDA